MLRFRGLFVRLGLWLYNFGLRHAEQSLHRARECFKRGLAVCWSSLHASILARVPDGGLRNRVQSDLQTRTSHTFHHQREDGYCFRSS